MDQLSVKFKYLTELPDNSVRQEIVIDEKQFNELKETHDKLKCSNEHKQRKIEKLSRLIEDYKIQASDAAIIDEKSRLIQDLQSKVDEKEEICVHENHEHNVLEHKKEKLNIQTQIMKGKLTEVQKNFDRITTNYSAFNNSQFASKYSLLLSNNALEDFRRFSGDGKTQFDVNIQKLERKLKSVSQTNLKLVDRASSVNDSRENKKYLNREFYNQYKNCLRMYKKTVTERKISTDRLELYKSKFRFITRFIQSDENQMIDDDVFGDTQVNITIQKLKELEYRSESLNFTYQKLTEQEIKLHHELSLLKLELSTIMQSSGKTSRKSEIVSNSKKLTLSTCCTSEYSILKMLYLLADMLFEALDKLQKNPNILSKAVGEKLHIVLGSLREIKVGIQKRKPFHLERFVADHIIGKHNYLDNRAETVNSIALNSREIELIFNDLIQNQQGNAKILSQIIEAAPIIKAFLDKETLRRSLISMHDRDIFYIINSMFLKCHLIFQDKFKSYTQDALYVLREINTINSTSQNLIENAEFDALTVPIEYKSRKNKSLSISPYKVMEKNTKKVNENIKVESVPVEIVQSKENKSIPRVYTLSAAAFKRQLIMKEILQNQKKETLLRTIEKKISKNSEKLMQLPYRKKFIIGSSALVNKLCRSSMSSRTDLRMMKSEAFL